MKRRDLELLAQELPVWQMFADFLLIAIYALVILD